MQRAHQTPQITSIVGQAPGHICIKLLGRHSTVVAHFGSSPPPPIQVVGRPPRELSCVIAVVDAGCGVVVRFSRSRCPEEKSCDCQVSLSEYSFLSAWLANLYGICSQN